MKNPLLDANIAHAHCLQAVMDDLSIQALPTHLPAQRLVAGLEEHYCCAGLVQVGPGRASSFDPLFVFSGRLTPDFVQKQS